VFVYRDAFDGLDRLCRKTQDWETLRFYADLVIGAMERGRAPVAPVGGRQPEELPNEAPGLMARAKAALALAKKGLKE
jgi:hypothetical protein